LTQQRFLAAVSDIGFRPDICTFTPSRREYYEIKPLSPSGVTEGIIKLAGLVTLMRNLSQPYIPGRTYLGNPSIPMMKGFIGPYPLAVSLKVELKAPGLLLYQLCLEGALREILEFMAMAALLAYIPAKLLTALIGVVIGGGILLPVLVLS
jgi:hypothetical protein